MLTKGPFDNLLEINRNKNGDYYFIYKVENVRNTINTKAKPRKEVLIVGVPQTRLTDYLNASVNTDKLQKEKLL